MTAVGVARLARSLARRRGARRGRLPVEVLGRVRRLGPVRGAHARPRGDQRRRRGQRDDEAPLDADGRARRRRRRAGRTRARPAAGPPSRRRAEITSPSPPGRWNALALASAPRQEQHAGGHEQDRRLDEREDAERAQALRHERAASLRDEGLLIPGQRHREDEHDRGDRGHALLGRDLPDALRRLGTTPESVRRSGCPPPSPTPAAAGLEAVDRVVQHRAQRDQQLAQRLRELAREVGRQRAARELEQREQRGEVRERERARRPSRAGRLEAAAAAPRRRASSARSVASRTSRSASRTASSGRQARAGSCSVKPTTSEPSSSAAEAGR